MKHPLPFPLWDFASPASAPLGLPMCQNRIAIPMWSYAMEIHPPAQIIEIGTYSGGFITALAVHAWRLKAKVYTYDRAFADESVTPLGAFLGINFRVVADVLAPAVVAQIKGIIARPGTTYVLCDGGDKPRELATFADALKPGDVIGAHDYVPEDGPNGDHVYWPCGEITKAHGDEVASGHDLEPWMQERFDVAAWLVYHKRSPVPAWPR